MLFTFSAALAGLILLLAWPFLPALTWALALAIVVWPLHAGCSGESGKNGRG